MTLIHNKWRREWIKEDQEQVVTAQEAQEEEAHARDLLQHRALGVLLHVQLVHSRDLHLCAQQQRFSNTLSVTVVS